MSFSLGEFVGQLESIVNIDSGFHCVEGIDQIIDFFEGGFASLGFYVARHAGGDALGDILVVTNRPADQTGRYDFMLLGHIDTACLRYSEKEALLYRRLLRLRLGRCGYEGRLACCAASVQAASQTKSVFGKLSLCAIIHGDEETYAQLSTDIMI